MRLPRSPACTAGGLLARPTHRAIVKQLEHVLLHAGGVAGAQDAEQLVVRDEEEARERAALGVQVLRQRLLADLQLLRQRLRACVHVCVYVCVCASVCVCAHARSCVECAGCGHVIAVLRSAHTALCGGACCGPGSPLPGARQGHSAQPLHGLEGMHKGLWQTLICFPSTALCCTVPALISGPCKASPALHHSSDAATQRRRRTGNTRVPSSLHI